MELQNPTTVKSVANTEKRLIEMNGVAVRSFLEDNTETGSWAYTVGLKSKDGQPVCLYVRAATSDHILEDILYRVSETVKVTDFKDFNAMTSRPFVISGYDNKITGSKLLFSIKGLKHPWFSQLGINYRTPIESQAHDTELFWVLIADEHNVLPFKEGYKDFMQVEPPSNTCNPEIDFDDLID